MAVRTDPEGNETLALFDLVQLDGREVLEIGCGDGRLTWRYADRAEHVTAIDPFEDGIRRAKEQFKTAALPIDFRRVAFEDFAVRSEPDAFDVTILSWSLC
jgi:2-polyprenyl-3-methyl-5-hydroxy-6-metoxy-1,4-benzoquinol methylase